MPYLDVGGANLYYETVGKGPLFLCIHGGNGSGDIWKGLAQGLKDQYTVVYYDRRGFTRSTLTDAQDYEHRLETDADDARKLIEHLGGNEQTATVLGTSSGAIVSLKLLSRHPSVIKKLIPHEPPALAFLPDREEMIRRQHQLYQTYRKSGVLPAMKEFIELCKVGPQGDHMLSSFRERTDPYDLYNTLYWFEREIIPYPCHEWDLALLEEQKHLLVLANGELSDPEALQSRANKVLSEKLGLRLTILPGAHVGYASHTADFTPALLEMIKEQEEGLSND